MSEPPTLPEAYRELAPECGRFLADHPDYDRNVFIMTRFVPGNRLLVQLDEELRRTLCRNGLDGLRADDRMYPHDRQLWKNVCVYMLSCKYGIAVLEDRVKDEFNPNVALEYGFMRALGKPVLLLKDEGFRNLRADIIGTLHESFDLLDIPGTMGPPITRWVHDLGIALRPGYSQLEKLAFRAYERLLKIKAAGLLRDPLKAEVELHNEFHYFGEEIAHYRSVLPGDADPAHRSAVDDAERSIAQQHDLRALPGLVERFAGLSRTR
jgi:hypothetical protein